MGCFVGIAEIPCVHCVQKWIFVQNAEGRSVLVIVGMDEVGGMDREEWDQEISPRRFVENVAIMARAFAGIVATMDNVALGEL